jgi:hypothetical protein
VVTGVLDLRLGRRDTDYYGGFDSFLHPTRGRETGFDFRASGFGMGSIRNWLVTSAFNNSRSLNTSAGGAAGLSQEVQFRDQQYPVYGDESQSTRLAESRDRFYLRLERNQDYLMWGDYGTEEFATGSQQFSATSRQLHAFKGNYFFGPLQVTGLYGDNVDAFQRDTLAADGTSGYYYLSHQLVVIGSENVHLELIEYNRPGTVVARIPQERGRDFEIDYDRGAILFNRPILRMDLDSEGVLLLRQIVVTYQYESLGDSAHVAGARLRYHLSRDVSQESWLGASYFRQDQGLRQFGLAGVDAFLHLDKNTRLIGEYARSRNESELGGPVNGDAYRLEVEFKGSLRSPDGATGRRGDGATRQDSPSRSVAHSPTRPVLPYSGRVYWRSAGSGFANDATVSFVPGQQRWGGQVGLQAFAATRLRLQIDHETNDGVAPRRPEDPDQLINPGAAPLPGVQVNNRYAAISLGAEHRLARGAFSMDFIHRSRKDESETATPSAARGMHSNQLQSRLTLALAEKLTFRAQNDFTLSADPDPLYPDRTLFGLDWAVHPAVKLRLSQIFYTGDNSSVNGEPGPRAVTIFDALTDYKLGPQTNFVGRCAVVGSDGNVRPYASAAVNHAIPVAPGTRVLLNYQRAAGGFDGGTGAGGQFAQPYAVGQGAAALGFGSGESYRVGVEYTAPGGIDGVPLKASAAYEARHSDAGNNQVILAALNGKLTPAVTGLVRFEHARAANARLEGLGNTAVMRMGLAYRDPRLDRVNALLRYEYRRNPAKIPDALLIGSSTESTEHLYGLEGIYAPNWRWEFYGKYAVRTTDSKLAQDFRSSSAVSLSQLRATYRLGYRTDLVGEARWIDQPEAGYGNLGFVLEGGYYLTPNLRFSAGYSLGRVKDRDLGASRQKQGLYIGATLKLNELFPGFGEPARNPAREEGDARREP